MVLLPILTLYHIDIKRAIALSVLSTLVISNSAAWGYVKRHVPSLRVHGFLEVYAVIGAVIGSLGVVALAQRLLLLLCGSVFLIFSMVFWRRKATWQPPLHQDAYSKELGWQGSYYDEVEGRTISYRGSHAVIAGPLVGVAAIISGSLGIGGSALIVLINNLVIGLPPKVSLTMSNLLLGVIALVGAGVYLEAGFVDPHLLVPLIVGVTLGALLGSKFIVKVPNRMVQVIFICVLVAVGVELLIRGVRGLS